VDDGGARARDLLQLGGGEADDADQLAALLDDGARSDQPGVDQRLQLRHVCEVEVGGQEDVVAALEPGDEVGEAGGPQVELVVADREAVVADVIQRDRVVPRDTLVEAGLQLRSDEEVVTGRDRHHARLATGLGGSAQGVGTQVLEQPPEAADAAGTVLVGEQIGLTVVVVQHGQREVDLLCLVRRGGCRRHDQADDHEQRQQRGRQCRAAAASVRMRVHTGLPFGRARV
jgi:hypothetical protein